MNVAKWVSLVIHPNWLLIHLCVVGSSSLMPQNPGQCLETWKKLEQRQHTQMESQGGTCCPKHSSALFTHKSTAGSFSSSGYFSSQHLFFSCKLNNLQAFVPQTIERTGASSNNTHSVPDKLPCSLIPKNLSLLCWSWCCWYECSLSLIQKAETEAQVYPMLSQQCLHAWSCIDTRE